MGKNLYNTRIIKKEGIKYRFNREIGLANIDVKLQRAKYGRDFEGKGMIALNKAVGKRFLGSEIKNVVNVGSGVGTFEFFNACDHKDINFIASEMDIKSTEWVKENRVIDNVVWCADDMKELLARNNGCKYDLAITIDVIEHVRKYKEFLDDFSKLSDKAVITTPNRDRFSIKAELQMPSYKFHVQEFNAGELFFILKMYYKNVHLYALQDINQGGMIEVGLYNTYDNIIAYCRN